MNKGKGLPSDLRSRRNTKVSINLDEEQLWEDDMLSKAEGLDMHATRWQNHEC
jgi:hypothetical protein